VSVPVESIVPSTSPSMSSSFRNLTEPLIETPRERRAPDCVGMNVRLDGPGTTDGSGQFVCWGSMRLRGAKREKGCMARIVQNYSAFRKGRRAKKAARCQTPHWPSPIELVHLAIYFLPFAGRSAQKAAWRKLCRIIGHLGRRMSRPLLNGPKA
jgi:hypothetical protein